ncbi:GNAT family N-acetyltransferase [Amycolatopsis sp. PS_44_ISF1]|uniref:GNAT family N-acetyltransferase n=1 Tax=Amycolatopsis sp. PS_44_ISF1 TaxID=2974917 RepID=UPI0028DE081E|nr:GNAT family N-acetyltransferase [Amycolatopsis sp. PS_44_ISF1]MDT8912712.1 GNAT family N-acetyltransferase [Amycolatopsis sp. PS_44_ISF1]
MSDYTVRRLDAEEHRAAWELFRTALHAPVPKDEDWDRARAGHVPGRVWGACDPELIGTARSFDAQVRVPGGELVPMAAVTGIGVRAGRTRRGVLTALQTAQLAEFAEREVVAASLHPTEGTIYGRFGYGPATLARDIHVDRHRARLRPEAPAGGEVSVHSLKESVGRWPGLYRATGLSRPATITRSAACWSGYESMFHRLSEGLQTAVHRGLDGTDGYACYRVVREDERPTRLELFDFHHTNPGAFAGLWRFLLSIDLVDEIRALGRPLDEPVELLFEDHRGATVARTEDESWFRLVDVPAALAARTYDRAEPVVIEVRDRFLPANAGRYRVGPEGAGRTDAEPDLRLDVSTLAMLYFGTWKATGLAAVGRIEAPDAEAPARADTLFGTRTAAWCGTFF